MEPYSTRLFLGCFSEGNDRRDIVEVDLQQGESKKAKAMA